MSAISVTLTTTLTLIVAPRVFRLPLPTQTRPEIRRMIDMTAISDDRTRQLRRQPEQASRKPFFSFSLLPRQKNAAEIKSNGSFRMLHVTSLLIQYQPRYRFIGVTLTADRSLSNRRKYTVSWRIPANSMSESLMTIKAVLPIASGEVTVTTFHVEQIRLSLFQSSLYLRFHNCPRFETFERRNTDSRDSLKRSTNHPTIVCSFTREDDRYTCESYISLYSAANNIHASWLTEL